MRAHKEQARLMLDVLIRNEQRLPADDFDRLYAFIKACIPRLPRCATLERDQELRERRRRKKSKA